MYVTTPVCSGCTAQIVAVAIATTSAFASRPTDGHPTVRRTILVQQKRHR